MKIAFLIRSLAYGGAERQLVALATALRSRGHSVLVMVFYTGAALAADLRAAGAPVHYMEKRHRGDMFGFLLRLTRLVRQEKPDVLHSYMSTPNILAAVINPLFPAMRVVWGVRSSDMRLDQYGRFARLAYRIECRLSRF